MLVSDQIDDALVQYALGVGILAVLIGYGLLHILRKRRARRRQPQIDIPEFLSGRTDGGDNSGGLVEPDWTEIHPLPRKLR